MCPMTQCLCPLSVAGSALLRCYMTPCPPPRARQCHTQHTYPNSAVLHSLPLSPVCPHQKWRAHTNPPNNTHSKNKRDKTGPDSTERQKGSKIGVQHTFAVCSTSVASVQKHPASRQCTPVKPYMDTFLTPCKFSNWGQQDDTVTQLQPSKCHHTRSQQDAKCSITPLDSGQRPPAPLTHIPCTAHAQACCTWANCLPVKNSQSLPQQLLQPCPVQHRPWRPALRPLPAAP